MSLFDGNSGRARKGKLVAICWGLNARSPPNWRSNHQDSPPDVHQVLHDTVLTLLYVSGEPFVWIYWPVALLWTSTALLKPCTQNPNETSYFSVLMAHGDLTIWSRVLRAIDFSALTFYNRRIDLRFDILLSSETVFLRSPSNKEMEVEGFVARPSSNHEVRRDTSVLRNQGKHSTTIFHRYPILQSILEYKGKPNLLP